jgi:D-psicose/D-tagatose/L-ribulose 3-epimerase
MRGSNLKLVQKARDFGFDAFEIPMFDPLDLPVADIRREFEANALDCTICAILPAGVNPISPDRETRKRSLLHLADCVKTAAELDAPLLGGPLLAPIGYLPNHRPTADEWKWAIEAFQSLGDLLDQTEVTLSIEPVNRSETFFIRTASDANKLCDAVAHPRVGVTIDTFHANIEEKSIVAALEALGPNLRHLHLSENDRGLLGSGHINFPEVLSFAARTKYEGYFILEGFGFPHDEPHAPGALWADEHLSPEEFALQGLAYIRGISNQEMSCTGRSQSR